jgi:prephenate dehydratase
LFCLNVLCVDPVHSRVAGVSLKRGDSELNLYYLGPEGTHSHEAAEWFQHIFVPDADLVACSTIPESVDRVFAGEQSDFACLPVENSIQGAVTPSWDALTVRVAQGQGETPGLSNAQILAAITLPIHHYAIYRDGVNPDLVEEVRSHPQALAQCQKRVRSLFPNARLTAWSSTAEAVRSVAEEDSLHLAALGSQRAANRYGLKYDDIPAQDRGGNATRFALIGPVGQRVDRDEQISVEKTAGGSKVGQGIERIVSLCLRGVAHQPGGLLGALMPFAKRGLNLARVESRPVGDQLGNYVFYVDVVISHEDDKAEQTLSSVVADLLVQKTDVIVLGKYPVLQVNH